MKRSRLRLISVALAVLLAGALLTVAPTPSLSAEREMRVDTEPLATHARQVATSAENAPEDVVAQHAGIDQFRMIGVSWAGTADVPVRVRVRSSGTWGQWKTLEPSAGPDSGSRERSHGGRTASEPMWVGRADGYEVEHGPNTAAVDVLLVRESGPRLRIKASSPAAHAAAPMPPINTRASWGARPPKEAVEYANGVATAFVHHTVNSNSYAPGDVPAILRGIQAFHMDSNGWNDIGYNFLVDRFGGIWEGRGGGMDRPVVGAHTLGFNTRSTGVAVIGDFTATNPTDASVQGVGRLLAWKFSLGGVDPAGTNVMVSGDSGSKYPAGTSVRVNNISGHRDVYNTDCPANLYNFLDQIRSVARAWWGAFFAYGPAFRGGVYVASGEFSGTTSTAEVVTGADAGGGPDVAIFRNDGLHLNGFFAFGAPFRGGVRVATGKVETGSSTQDIIAAAGAGGGPDVRVFHGDGKLVNSFFAYGGGFTGGVFVASGNVNAIPGDEIVTGAGAGGGPDVRVFTGTGTLLKNFFAYGAGFTGGVHVATGDLNGDGQQEIITGPGQGGGPNVRVFRSDGTQIANFMPYAPGFTGGVFVGTVRAPDGKRDLIVTGPGPGGGPHVRIFAIEGTVFGEFVASGPDDTGGTRVAGGPFIGTPPGQIVITRGPPAAPLVNYRRLDGSAFFP